MTHIDEHTQAPETPIRGQRRARPVSRRAVLGSAVAVATVAGATVLGVATLASDDQNKVTERPHHRWAGGRSHHPRLKPRRATGGVSHGLRLARRGRALRHVRGSRDPQPSRVLRQ